MPRTTPWRTTGAGNIPKIRTTLERDPIMSRCARCERDRQTDRPDQTDRQTDRSALTADDPPRRIRDTHLNHNNNILTNLSREGLLSGSRSLRSSRFSVLTHTSLSCSVEGSDPTNFLVDHGTILLSRRPFSKHRHTTLVIYFSWTPTLPPFFFLSGETAP